MDGKQFDRLTKSLSSGASRRQMLGSLGAVAAGLVTGRTAAAKARPVNNGSGCAQPGRSCGGDYPACCGSKLTCGAATGGLASSCGNAAGNDKCCFEIGTACHGHCECCAPATGCSNGVCV